MAWHMTQEEYFTEVTKGSMPPRRRTDQGWIVGGTKWWDTSPSKHGVHGGKPARYGDYIDAVHKCMVTSAVERGEDVPAHVLAEYPDIKKPLRRRRGRAG